MVQSNKKNILEKALHFSRTHFWVIPALFFITSIFAVNVNAQVIQSSPSVFNLFNIGDPELNELKYGCPVKPLEGFFGGVVVTGNRLLSGVSPTDAVCINDREEKGITDDTGMFSNYRTAGLYDYVTVANALVINERPASGKAYVEQQVYALANPGKVSAQEPSYYYPGTGFSLQKPVQSFWGWSVNVTYGFLIILIIAIAFAIMFRTRLGGAASVTLQSAIPNIAIAMILVPLSYAITGVFIDAITLGTNVSHEFLMGPGAAARDVYNLRNDNNNNGTVDPGEVSEINLPIINGPDVEDRGLYADDVRVSWYGVFSAINVKDEIDDLIPNEADSNTPALIKLLINILDIFGGDEQGIDSWIAEIINFIVSVVLFLTGLRIFRLLIKKYITLLLNPIFSPFVFATIAIPGTGTKNIMTFLKQLGAASLFFIVYYTMALLSIVLTSQAFLNNIPGAETSGYIPPGLGLSGLFAGTSLSNQLFAVILSIAGIGVYLQIPKTLKDLDAKLGTDKSALMPILNDTMTSWKQSVGVGRVLARSPGTVADSIDKARGKTPGEYGTLRGFTRRKTSDYRQNLSNVAERGGAVGGLAKIAGGTLGGASRLAGSNASGSFDASKDNILKVGIKMGAADVGGGFLSLTDKQLNELVTRYGAGTARISKLFKITFEAENFRLPTTITQVTVLEAIQKRATTEETADKVVKSSAPGFTGGTWDGFIPSRTARSVQDIDIFDIWATSRGGILFYPETDGPYESDGKAFEIPMVLEVTNPAALASGEIIFGSSYVAKKRYFRVNGVTTKNNIRFAIQSTPGSN